MNPNHPKGEGDSKGADESETQKITSIDPKDPLGNERATAEHSGEETDRDEEE